MNVQAGSVAVITGGGSGIGRAIGRALATEGCRLVLADIDHEALAGAEAELTSLGAEVLTMRTDVAVVEEVQALADAALARFGQVDIVVNNAGVIAWNTMRALTLDEWRWVMGVNLWGVIHGVHVFLPIFDRQGTPAHFVNTSSVGGVLAETPFMTTYSVTKAGVIGLSLALDSELKMTGSPIGVSILCPGNTAQTAVVDSERSRPSAAAHRDRDPGVDDLVKVIHEVVDNGQPVDVLAARVLEAIRDDQLWVFPHPEAKSMLQPRLDGLGEVLTTAAMQTLEG
jgi:NAD(P)-dependent dehydrogenase (short-subunit alcohol dehydrogenase family)